jgi:pyrimidine-nucleoside phosphorylase
MLILGKIADLETSALQMAEEVLDNGKAWDFFKKLISAQGGDLSYIEKPDLLPRAPYIQDVRSSRSGYLSLVHAREVGLTALQLGAGRAKKGDPIDYSVGVEIYKKVGDHIQAGELLFTIHANQEEDLAPARKRLLEAHHFEDQETQALPQIYEIIR